MISEHSEKTISLDPRTKILLLIITHDMEFLKLTCSKTFNVDKHTIHALQ